MTPDALIDPNSVVFQWVTPYMISPDQANLGVKAIYVWAGLLVPTIVLLFLYYPEVSLRSPFSFPMPFH